MKKDELKTAEFVSALLEKLGQRSKDVIEKRFGLKKKQTRHTLESIGKEYGITRERVRQIENAAKKIILETSTYKKDSKKFINFLKKEIEKFGGVISEKEFLSYLTDDKDTQDHLHFLLHISDPFFVEKKKDFKDKVWFTDKDSYEAFEKSLEHLYKDLESNELLTEKEIINRFTDKLKKHTANKKLMQNETVKKLISISKKIDSNELNQWGLADSRNIKTKGVRDYAYLILNNRKEPMHFKDLTKEISERFGKKANVATVHNELIKDERFILVGRGKYALKEWGIYSAGTVADVVKEVLKSSKKSLSRKEIVEEVLKRKDVKEQTILINLANKSFKRTKDGRYKLA